MMAESAKTRIRGRDEGRRRRGAFFSGWKIVGMVFGMWGASFECSENGVKRGESWVQGGGVEFWKI
jgi:hypothetical protein